MPVRGYHDGLPRYFQHVPQRPSHEDIADSVRAAVGFLLALYFLSGYGGSLYLHGT